MTAMGIGTTLTCNPGSAGGLHHYTIKQYERGHLFVLDILAKNGKTALELFRAYAGHAPRQDCLQEVA